MSACRWYLKSKGTSQLWRLKSVILATWEVEIRRIMVQGQAGEKVLEIPSQPVAECSEVHLSSQLCRKHK
jgi:hypothetical protein